MNTKGKTPIGRGGAGNKIESWFQQAVASHRAGRLDLAEQLYLRVLKFNGKHPHSLVNLGVIRKAQGRYKEALELYTRAVEILPGHAEAHSNMGHLLGKLGKQDEALEHLRLALRYKPDFGDAWINMSHRLFTMGKLLEAEAAAREGIRLLPNSPGAMNNLGNALYPQFGKLDDAIDCFKQALRIQSNFESAASNLLFCVNNHPELTTTQIAEHYQTWASAHEPGLIDRWAGFSNSRNPARRIRIGYVSPDFRKHSMRYFLAPLIEGHDHQQFEIFLYSDSIQTDESTKEYQESADHWRTIRHLSDREVTRLIKEDSIDVLIDLAGHTADNRLFVFAQRAAPVQVSYLGFGFTTGLKNMDYFIADETFVPRGKEDPFSESIFRLPRPQYVYRADPVQGVAELPAQKNGYVTFGCFSRTIRINAKVIRSWANVLRAVPGSKLLLNTRYLVDKNVQRQYLDAFLKEGIEEGRVQIIFESPPWRSYTEMVDIVFDPFPHNGGTTTFDALWMGCPVVSMRGHPGIGCFGATILGALGLNDWLASSEDEYVKIAVSKASDLSELATLRNSLRNRMMQSELCDEKGLVAAIEDAYKTMWKDWSESCPVELEAGVP